MLPENQPSKKSSAASSNKATVILWFIAGIILFALLVWGGWQLFYGVIVPKSVGLSALPALLVLGFAFAAGLASFFAPCPIAVLPAYLSFFLGTSTDYREQKVSGIKVGLVASGGVISFYLIIGIILATLGTSLAFYVNYLKFAVIILIFLLGVSFVRSKQLPSGWLDKSRTFLGIPAVKMRDKLTNYFALKSREGGASMKGAYFYGLVYGIGAAACFLPVILTISLFPILNGEFILGLASFIVYALAISLLLVLVTVLAGRRREQILQKATGAGYKIKRISGIVLILTSLYLLSFYVVTGM